MIAFSISDGLVAVLLCSTVLIALFQFAILTQCGVVHRRLGVRLGDRDPVATEPAPDLVGMEAGLPPKATILFASLSCTQCSAVLRAVVDTIAARLRIYLVDKPTSSAVEESMQRYPEFRFAAEPGEEFFNRIGAKGIPFFVRTDGSGRIAFASVIDSPAQLLGLMGEEKHETAN